MEQAYPHPSTGGIRLPVMWPLVRSSGCAGAALRATARALVVLALVTAGLVPAARPAAAAPPVISLAITPLSAAPDTNGNGILEHDYGPNDGLTDCVTQWRFDLSISDAPLLNGRIELRFTSVRWLALVGGITPDGILIANPAWTLVHGSTDLTAPYDDHVATINLLPTLNPGTSGISASRTFRLCTTTGITPRFGQGTVQARLIGEDEEGNPVSVPAAPVTLEFRPPGGLLLSPVTRPIVPALDPATGTVPGYNLTFRFNPSSWCSNYVPCEPVIAQLTQTFSLPPGAQFVWAGHPNPPADGIYNPAPPSGDPATFNLPSGTPPLDLSFFGGLSPGDPMPAGPVTMDLRAWPHRTCPTVSDLPSYNAPFPIPGPNVPCDNTDADYARLAWEVTVWVPTPPTTTSYTSTVSAIRDRDWDGTFETNTFMNQDLHHVTSVLRTYTINPAPPIVNFGKDGCDVRASMIMGWSEIHCPVSSITPTTGGGGYTVTFRTGHVLVLNPTVVDVIPPGFSLRSWQVPSKPPGSAPGDNEWSTSFHPGPCDHTTTTGWVPEPGWAGLGYTLADVRCVRWHTPFTSLDNHNHAFQISVQRDPNLADAFAPPASPSQWDSPHGPLTAEWHTDPAVCYRTSQPDLSAPGWVPAGSVPVGDVRCVRWSVPDVSGNRRYVTSFMVDPTAGPFSTGEGIWGLNRTWMWSDNSPNATFANPLQASAWNGAVNKTAFWTSVNPHVTSLGPPGSSFFVDAEAGLWRRFPTNGTSVRNWTIRVRIPDYLVWDPGFGATDGVPDGVQVLRSPRQWTNWTGTTHPYSCTFIPDSTPHIPGGGDVECVADGDTEFPPGNPTDTSWVIRLRLYRAPGMPPGSHPIRSFTYHTLPTAPYTPGTIHPVEGPIAPDGAPYGRRQAAHVPSTWIGDVRTVSLSPPVTTGVLKVLANPAEDANPAPGQLIEYDVTAGHQDIRNPDLTNAYVYDFPGYDPTTGAVSGDVVPEFVSAVTTAGGPIFFQYTCDTNGDPTPTPAEAASYVWVADPWIGPCTGPSSVIGIRARLDYGGPGRFPSYAPGVWDIGDPVDASTLTSSSFRVVVRVPEDAWDGALIRNRAVLMAQQMPLPTFSSTISSTVIPMSGQVTVEKRTDPPGYDRDFVVRLTGPGPYDEAQAINAALPTVATFSDMEVAGTYRLREIAIPANWTLVGISCRNELTDAPMDPEALVLEPGIRVRCVVENRADPATLLVRKATSPENYDQDFPVRLTGPGRYDETGTVNAATDTEAVFGNLVPGAPYTLTEEPVPGWWLSAVFCEDTTSGDPVPGPPDDLVLEPGQQVICTLVNTAFPTALVVRKTTSPVDVDLDFQAVVRDDMGFAVGGPVNDATEQFLIVETAVGRRYTVAEDPPPEGWELQSITCRDQDGSPREPAGVIPEPDDRIACEITNRSVFDLTVSKTVDARRRPVGDRFRFTLRWENLGPGPAFGVVVTDTLPDGLTLIGAPDTCEVDGRVIRCRVADVAEPGDSGTVRLTATATRLGSFENVAVVSSSVPDMDPSNDEDRVTVDAEMVDPVPGDDPPELVEDPPPDGASGRTPLAYTGAGSLVAMLLTGAALLVSGLGVRASRRRVTNG